MKPSPVRPRRAQLASFTLIELLVVIAIIAILVAVLLPAVGLVLNQAKRARAANTANQIQTACLNYYTEYSVYPVPFGTSGDYVLTDLPASQSAWGNLIDVLSGNFSPSTGLATTPTTITNAHGIAFLSLRSGDVASSGGDAPLNFLPLTSTNLYFNIAINSSYSGVLGTNSPSNVMPNFAAGTTAAGGTSTAGVALWENLNGKTSSTNINWWVHTYY